MIKKVGIAVGVLLCAASVAAAPASAAGHGRPDAPFTLAVYGDAPYGTTPTDTAEFAATPSFIDSVNADPDVSTVLHVGDIHSGKQYCTAGYDRSIYQLWTRFADPLVYTPGDNEWADCHKPGEGGGSYDASIGQIHYVLDPSTGQPVDYASGNPAANLAFIRSVFFRQPGRTLGSGTLHVVSQAVAYDRRHPADAQFVENVLWIEHGVVFVTVNIPGGSNNDADPWYGAPITTAQQQEAAQRTAADLRWLDTAFGLAHVIGASGVAIAEQADMWDLDGKPAAHLSNFEPLVGSIANHTLAYGGPVLLLAGDSHVYRSDNPFVQNAPCAGDAGVCSYDAWSSHPFYDVPNIHRVIVHGSTFPLEWLKLTVDPGADAPASASAFGPFSWQRMPQQ